MLRSAIRVPAPAPSTWLLLSKFSEKSRSEINDKLQLKDGDAKGTVLDFLSFSQHSPGDKKKPAPEKFIWPDEQAHAEEQGETAEANLKKSREKKDNPT